MRRLLFSMSLFTAGLVLLRGADTPAGADAEDSQTLASKITDVTVYADRAQVTRVASVARPAATGRYAFVQLPGWIDEGSVRVSLAPAAAGQILDVQVRRTYLARASDQEMQKSEAALREISDQIAALDDERAVLDAQAKQVDAIRLFSLDKLPKDAALREVKPEEYTSSVNFITGSLREVARAKRDLEKQRRDLQPELDVRQRRLSDHRQRAQLEQRTVVVTLQGSGQPATLALSYLLPGATWEPIHELRAATEARTVSLAAFAVVTQTTGEDWTDAALTLSTQKTTETMKIPELDALLVGGRKLPRLWARGRDTFLDANKNWVGQNTAWNDFVNPDARIQQEYRERQREQLSNVKRVEQIFEGLQQRGTTAHFPALSRQTVRTDGRPVRVPLGLAELAAQPRILAAPEMSLNAARIVDLTNTTAQPFLPGRVSLFLSGSFLGLTETEFVAPGEGFALYLGVADPIKLARTLDKKRSALTRGGTKTKMQISFLVTVENLSDQNLACQLADRVPVSETDEVRVSGVRIQPEGKPDAKGLLHWDLSLPAKQTKEFRIEYALEYPAELPKAEAEVKGRSSLAPGASSAPTLYDQIRSLEKRF